MWFIKRNMVDGHARKMWQYSQLIREEDVQEEKKKKRREYMRNYMKESPEEKSEVRLEHLISLVSLSTSKSKSFSIFLNKIWQKECFII